LHPPVLIFTLAVAVAAGLLFGISAAWRASRVDLNTSLKEGGQQGGSRSRLRPALVIAEVTLAVVAVVGATEMARGFQAMFAAYQGFKPDRILTIRFAVPSVGYETSAKWTAFVDQAINQAASLPETESITASSNLPGALQFNPVGVVELEGAPAVQRGPSPSADLQVIGAGYFTTLNIPVLAGRPIDATDGADTPAVIVVNQRFANRFWPGENPIGRRIRFDTTAHAPWRTVIGVVADVNQFWFQREPRPVVFVPHRQANPRGMYLAIRTHRDPLRILPALRERIRKIDPSLPLYNPRSMDQLMQETMSAMRMTTGMMMAFGLLALVLSAIGVYGVMAYSVTQRHREFGIRIALGAHPRAVLGMVLRQALILAATGGILGLVTGIGVSRAMAGIMYGVGTTSLAILLGAPLLLASVCLIASWIPARAVMLVNPATVLRRD
jgi:putative ABC transport system permease protein